MAEYASKGVAGTALGLGIAGTVGLVNQLGNCGGCGNGGLLGGLFGGNNCCNRGVGGLARANDELACLRNTVCRITQTIVPASAICPQPMPQYNSWTAPTGTPTQVNVSGTVNTRSATCVG